MSPKAQVPANLRATPRRVGAADRFRLMADHAPVMIWLADRSGRSVYFNPQWLRFRGRRLEEDLGLAWVEGVHPDDRDRCLAAHAAAVETGEPFELEFRLRRADGEHRRVRMNGAPITDGTQPAGFVGSCMDVTEQVAGEERRASELERVLALVAHELRSPLNGIKSWTHVLENELQETSDPTLRRAIDGIMTGVEQQVRLIEDLLERTRALGDQGHESCRLHAQLPEEAHMTERQKQSHPNEDDQRHNRDAEHPQRPDSDTLKGPGGRESKAEEEERNSATRRGEL